MEVRGWKIAIHKVIWVLAVSHCIANVFVTCAPMPVSADKTTNSTNYWSTLYQNASNKLCQLPKVDNENYFRTKVNLACNLTAIIAEESKKLDLKSTPKGACSALLNLFPKLCNLPYSNATVDTLVDVKQINGLGLKTVCAKIQELFVNVSQNSVSTGTWQTSFSFKQHKEECMTSCTNAQLKNITADQGIEVNPVCMLLLTGYSVYQHSSNLSKLSKNQVNGNPDPVVSTSDSKFVIPQIKNVSDTSGVAAENNLKATTKTNNGIEAIEWNGILKASQQKTQPAATLSSSQTIQNTSNTNENGNTKGQDIVNSASNVKKKDQISSHTSLPVISASVNGIANSSFPSKDDASKHVVTPSVKITKISSSTAGTVDGRASDFNDVPTPPSILENKLGKSSTEIPKEGNMGDNKRLNTLKVNSGNDKKLSASAVDKNSTLLQAVTVTPGEVGGIRSNIVPQKAGNDDVGNSNIGEDDGEYDTDNEEGLPKPPSKASEKDIDVPETARNFEGENLYKPSRTRFQNNRFSEDLPPYENHGTTINVSLNESEDTGFFNYFLFFITLLALLYFIVHNKKKLIAYFIEGKRPRSRGRRSSSSSSQYRRLENNFD